VLAIRRPLLSIVENRAGFVKHKFIAHAFAGRLMLRLPKYDTFLSRIPPRAADGAQAF
jgi:hypothetical protein